MDASTPAAPPRCRLCDALLEHVFIDLGASPIANAYLTQAQLSEMEPFFPLRVHVCSECFLVQVQAFEARERIFADDYAYFSSYSASWLAHCERYAQSVVERFGLEPGQRIVEVASNDGYLLQFFHRRGFEVLGIEPAAGVAEAAALRGVPTVQRFFGEAVAAELRESAPADLMIANNVLAHVPDLNDFVAGFKVQLAEHGVLTLEFPHLVNLVEEAQFDTIYHEHFSYFSFLVARELFSRHGLTVFDVEKLSTHGGSLRLYVRHEGNDELPVAERVAELERAEREAGYADLEIFLSFEDRARRLKFRTLETLLEIKSQEASIAAYGAPAKGNTMLNYCGIGTEFIDFTVDISPHKQGNFLPGTHIPIRHPDALREARPEYVFILPWNLREEIMEQIAFIREWGAKFIVRDPDISILP